MQNLTKEKVRVELQLQNIRYERQSECKKQIDNEMENLTKPSNFSEKIALILQEQQTKQCQTEQLSPYKGFQRKSNGLKKTGCH